MSRNNAVTAWASRTAGNNTQEVEFDLYTVTTANAGNFVLDLQSRYVKVSGGVTSNIPTNARLFYSNLNYSLEGGSVNTPATTPTITSGTWTNFKLKTDTVNKNMRLFVNNVDTGVVASFSPPADHTYEFLGAKLVAVAPGTDPNAARETFLVDNFKVSATNEAILTTNILPAQANANVTVYPNPTSDVLNISSKLEVLSSEIYNLGGQLVASYGAVSQLDIANLAKGNYILKINGKDKVYSQQIIKN